MQLQMLFEERSEHAVSPFDKAMAAAASAGDEAKARRLATNGLRRPGAGLPRPADDRRRRAAPAARRAPPPAPVRRSVERVRADQPARQRGAVPRGGHVRRRVLRPAAPAAARRHDRPGRGRPRRRRHRRRLAAGRRRHRRVDDGPAPPSSTRLRSWPPSAPAPTSSRCAPRCNRRADLRPDGRPPRAPSPSSTVALRRDPRARVPGDAGQHADLGAVELDRVTGLRPSSTVRTRSRRGADAPRESIRSTSSWPG